VLRRATCLLAAAALTLLTPTGVRAEPAPARQHQPGPATLVTRIPIGRGVDVGGFSDLFPADRSGQLLWTVTDRGPNYDRDDGQGFVVPAYQPRILLLAVHGHKLSIVRQIPLRLPRGGTDPVTGSRLVTGLPNVGTDSPPFGTDNQPLPLDPYGVDSEGLVRAPDGTFWVSEEYRPSVLHVAADGTVLSRLVPADQTSYVTPGVPVLRILPAILSTEKSNRGLEGLALSADGRTLYAGMQSPLNNPDSKVSKKSRNLRIVRVDISHPGRPRVDAEFLNVRDADSADDGDWETSAMVWLGRDRLLVEERDGQVPTAHTRYYAVDFRPATNLLGGRFDDRGTAPSLEQIKPADLAAAGVTPGAKTLVYDAAAAGLANGKLEGAVLVRDGRHRRLLLVNDNDFGVAGVGDAGDVEFTGIPERLDTVPLPSF
jgi:Esterase-like activity of phytase